jgi:DNA-binding MltR family transcriptional regulator
MTTKSKLEPIDDLEEFYDDSPDRGLAISLPAIVENRLTSILREVMRPDEKLANELFQPSGPLGTFSSKIRLAYMLELVDKKFYEDVSTINKIRNLFAHKVEMKRLEQHPVSSWIKGMHIYSTLVKVRDNPSHPDKEFEAALGHMLQNQLSTMRDSFRECIRMVITQLNIQERAIKAHNAKIAKTS